MYFSFILFIVPKTFLLVVGAAIFDSTPNRRSNHPFFSTQVNHSLESHFIKAKIFYSFSWSDGSNHEFIQVRIVLFISKLALLLSSISSLIDLRIKIIQLTFLKFQYMSVYLIYIFANTTVKTRIACLCTNNNKISVQSRIIISHRVIIYLIFSICVSEEIKKSLIANVTFINDSLQQLAYTNYREASLPTTSNYLVRSSG